ncbi:MAG: SDR family oxidoreductase [Phyllobacteriaceae bacterium]|nr:SDR family oxidoreductase [Phyllobacteriaceae bacterium]
MKRAAIVTGGASGIGLATALRLREDGWPVAIIDANAETLAEAEAEIGDPDVLFIRADVTDEDDIGDAFDQAADALGPIGALVNCAAIARDQAVEDTTAEQFRQMLDVNVVGSFIACRAALERMADALAIVNVSSVSGLRANRGRVAYGASKAAVKLMTETMALELAARNVRVNGVAPGPTETPMIARLHGADDRREWLSHVPMGRYGDPAELAAAIAFLVSPESGFITGHTLAVDGGFLAAGLMART